MKKLLLSSSIVALLVPAFALAAFNDVTLTTSAVLNVGGIALNVYSSSATIQSTTVSASNATVTLLPGSSITVLAPARNVINQSGGTSLVTVSACDNNTSQMGFTYPAGAGSAVTITITPSTTICGSTGGGGAGGGGSYSAPAVLATPAAASAAPVVAPAAAPATVTPAAPAAPAATSPRLSPSQIQSILDVLASFNVDASTIASVRTSLGGVTTGSVTSTAVHVFRSNLSTGSRGSEVKALQQYLNAHGYLVAASGAGSPGNETTRFGPATRAALIKYQRAKGITPASGYFGPKTRAAINAGS